jgi:hypothetical protein
MFPARSDALLSVKRTLQFRDIGVGIDGPEEY